MNIKINNSYESEPSSSSSLNEPLEYNTVYDGSMHLPYVLKPPSYETEVIIPADGNFSASNEENKIPLMAMSGSISEISGERSPTKDNGSSISPCLSQKSVFKGFSGSPYGKLQREFFSSPLVSPQVATSLEYFSERQPLPTKGGIVFSRFYNVVMEENSCNAVDIQLSNEEAVTTKSEEDEQENGVDYLLALSKESDTNVVNLECKPFKLSTELSFNGKIKSLTPPSEDGAYEITGNSNQHLTNFSKEDSNGHVTQSFILKKYSNEKSPDLFGDDEDDVDANNENQYSFRSQDLIEVIDTTNNTDDTMIAENIVNESKENFELPEAIADCDENACEKTVANNSDLSINKSITCPTESGFADDQTCEIDSQQRVQQFVDSYSFLRENCRRERELLRRIRKCLAGVPPPPSVTIPQLDIFSAVISRKEDILHFTSDVDTCSGHDSCSSSTKLSSLFKPTHSIVEAKEVGWRQVLGIRQHGVCFNLCKASENNEYLGLSVIERFIGAETASSYRNSPSSAKKRNARMKLLTQSPGNRLSHLARRRATFSSAQLATQKSINLHGPQIMVEVKKKNKHRRKNTPKRMTPGSKKKTRKTPSSSARKRLFRCDLIKPGPSREASKRALFQSPPKQLEHKQPVQRFTHSIKPEIANRVEKSKRALFSPDIQSEGTNFSANSSYQPGSFNTHRIDSILKRKRSAVEDDDTGDSVDLPSQSSKLFRGGAKNLTPRALKIKSQSFCIGTGSSSTVVSADVITMSSNAATSNRDIIPHTNMGVGSSSSLDNTTVSSTAGTVSKIQRSYSEMVAQTNSLTENQRKKLLWAVSQALQEKKITTKHESFKQYAAVLARVVRRIFQEYFQKSSTSNSETLLRLAKRYVHNVIGGRGADDIYLQAKAKILRDKNESNCRISGYIGPEEYQRLKDSQQQHLKEEQTNLFGQNPMRSGSLTDIFGGKASLDSFGLTSSHEITLSKNNIAATFTSQSQLVENTSVQPSSLKKLPIQSKYSQQNSSSKNNTYGLALRENVNFDADQRRSAQKNFTGKDQRNVSPYANNNNHYFNNNQLKANMVQSASVGKSQSQTRNIALDSSLLSLGTNKVKRQISFDN